MAKNTIFLKKRVRRNGLFFIVPLLLLVIGMSGCASKSSSPYNPYKNKKKITPANYKGRQENRLLSLDRATTPPATSFERNRFAEKQMPKDAVPEPALHDLSAFEDANYQLGPGDVVEVIYQLKAEPRNEEYRLSIQDKIAVKFFYTPNYDSEVTIRVDGKVSLPLIGDVLLRGKTISEITEELNAQYGDILKDPVIQVSIVNSNWAIEELKRAITTAPRGQSRLEPVRPDGFLSLPLVGDVKVGGMTIPQASASVIERYRAVGVIDIDVTIVLLEAKSAVAYVIGEVLNPGPVILIEREDVWRTISKVGGFTTLADKNHVVVAKTDKNGDKRFVFDFTKWNTSLDSKENTRIRRGDIIYVPKAIDTFVYLLGAVEKPGRIEIDTDTKMTASQALAMGGKINSGAKESKALILRKSPMNDPIVIEVNMVELFDKKNYNEKDDYPPRDPILEPGDIIYVPNAVIGDINRFAEAYFKNGIWTIIPFSASAVASYTINK